VQNAESLGLTQKILEINPEFYTLWNYRREIIEGMMSAGDLTASSVGESEKGLTQLALEKNPKSYCAWHHRRWAAELGCLDMAEELATCNKFLDLDSRNCAFTATEFLHLFRFSF
jgi:geranylgeranyl transferase type-2 subunit alpha